MIFLRLRLTVNFVNLFHPSLISTAYVSMETKTTPPTAPHFEKDGRKLSVILTVLLPFSAICIIIFMLRKIIPE